MSKYFTNLLPGGKVHRSNGDMVDLSRMPTDAYAKRLYVSGFKYIGITPEAAKVLKSCPTLLLERLLIQKKNEKKADEVEILQEVLSSKSGKSKKDVE